MFKSVARIIIIAMFAIFCGTVASKMPADTSEAMYWFIMLLALCATLVGSKVIFLLCKLER
jgi:hypothetical protein